jgi:hypothetical protein
MAAHGGRRRGACFARVISLRTNPIRFAAAEPSCLCTSTASVPWPFTIQCSIHSERLPVLLLPISRPIVENLTFSPRPAAGFMPIWLANISYSANRFDANDMADENPHVVIATTNMTRLWPSAHAAATRESLEALYTSPCNTLRRTSATTAAGCRARQHPILNLLFDSSQWFGDNEPIDTVG